MSRPLGKWSSTRPCFPSLGMQRNIQALKPLYPPRSRFLAQISCFLLGKVSTCRLACGSSLQMALSSEAQYQVEVSCRELRNNLGYPVLPLAPVSTSRQLPELRADFEADFCSPSCGAGGVCLTNGTCACLEGFTGSKCDQCQPGYFGRDCKACSSLCGPGKCDDGRQGSGGCRGSAGNSTLSCNCLYGTCTSSTTCACAAGWVSTLTELCGKCGDGFYLDGDRNCRACALGAKTCTSLTAATSCEAGLQLSSGICTATRCSDGQYWDGNQCSTCSPACTTCFGPNPTDCLRCASPRFNLNGTCVGYDANGACDTSSSSLAGIYIADNTQGRCDACPSGALDCGIPNFSVASTRNQLVSTSCHEGYVLQSGSCILACSNGTFLPSEATPSINGTCQSCDLTVCATCVGSATWCSSCQNGLYADLSGKCVLTCPSGTFADNGRCVSCPPEMITCSSANNALSCASGWPILRNGRCEAVCPSRQYYDAATSSCRSCTSSATSCIGPGANQATSCDDGLRLKGGECLPASCSGGTIPGLNICLEDLVADGAVKAASTWWPFLLVAFGMAGIIGGVAFWLIRTRRKTRAQTKAFGDAMDDRDVERRLNDLSRQETGGKSLEEVLETEFEEEEEACPTRRRRDLFAMLSLQARRLNSIEPRSTRVVHRFGKQKADEYARRSGVAGPQPPPAYSPSTSTSYPESDKKITFETPEELSPPESPAMQLYAPIFHESTSAPQIASPASVAAAPPRMPRSIIKSGRDEVELDDLSGFQTLRPSAIPDAGRRISFADAKPDRTSKDSIDLLGVRNGA